jgi:transmembrane sensor
LSKLLHESEVDGEALWGRIQVARGRLHAARGPKLPVPLASVLAPGDDVARARSHHWRAIVARRRPPERGGRWALALGASGLALALAVFALLASWRRPAPVDGPRVAAALTLHDGQPLSAAAASTGPRELTLADASKITLMPGARLTPLSSSPHHLDLLLEDGTAVFAVTPGGPRRWTIHAGLARVEVVGTVFRVERGVDALRVDVSRGIVIVRGASVPGEVQRLTAGESLRVTPSVRAPGSEPAQQEADVSAPAEPPSNPVVVSRQASPTPVRQADWRAEFAAGRFDAAYRALGKAGLRRSAERALEVNELLSLADVARLSGHPSDAVFPLRRVVDGFSDSQHAAVAAFTLGRVLFDQLHAHGDAASAFERAVALHPPHALLEDCHARLVQAYARVGDRASAERAAGRYRALFPNGRHLADVEAWATR